MKDIVIVSACRTAIGAYGGSLKDSDQAVLGAVVHAPIGGKVEHASATSLTIGTDSR